MNPMPGQQHHDVGGDHELRRRRRARVADAPTAIIVARPPAGDLLVEPRDPAPGDRHLQPVDAHRRDRREHHDQPVAAQLHADAGAHHAPAEGDRPAGRSWPVEVILRSSARAPARSVSS